MPKIEVTTAALSKALSRTLREDAADDVIVRLTAGQKSALTKLGFSHKYGPSTKVLSKPVDEKV